MRAALAAHDEVLRAAIDAHGGWFFKHTGDGVCAAFGSARAAIDTAVAAQLRLRLPVRMGVATGEAENRDEDYFGPAVNRAARVMAAGHGGQILVAAATAALVSAEGLVDLGERRLRDLSGAEHLYQVHADGLGVEFPPLRTIDVAPGNLPVVATSFVGRDVEINELCEVVRGHRMATLTGVGGIGKTRLALQVSAELTGEFPDGVWLIEFGPVSDSTAVADAVATTLGVTQQAGMSLTWSVAEALSGRRLLLIVDNCEHVLDAAADVVETILARASTVKVLATSREGLRVDAEHLWPVPSLDVAGGKSSAVELFVTRARALNPGFTLDNGMDLAAVSEICARLDGIALAIELAAARMVSMSPQDVRDRLGNRFRLLSGSPRGLERHQTLRHAVQWSYDLLDDNERALLQRCSVFADGFDLAAATHMSDGLDEYAVLDILDSLVRKSLVTVNSVGGHARYGMLETIREFADDHLAAAGTTGQLRDRYASYFAEQAVTHFAIWDGPRCRVAVDWVDVEFSNLRAGFRWATDQSVSPPPLPSPPTPRCWPRIFCGTSRSRGPRSSSERPPQPTYANYPGSTPPLGLARSPVGRRQPSVTPEGRSRWNPSPATTLSNAATAHSWRPTPTPSQVEWTGSWRSAPDSSPSRGLLTSSVCVG
jgi:predicted ATPase